MSYHSLFLFFLYLLIYVNLYEILLSIFQVISKKQKHQFFLKIKLKVIFAL